VFQQTTARTPSNKVAIFFFVKIGCIYFLSGEKIEERDDEKAGFIKERFVARVGCEKAEGAGLMSNSELPCFNPRSEGNFKNLGNPSRLRRV
jgi:hypothetical protein